MLEAQGLQPKVIEYLKTPPTTQELKTILKQLKRSPRELMRTKEQIFKEKNLSNPALSEEALIQVMVDNPILIERPIVIANDKAVIGRPPENVLEIL